VRAKRLNTRIERQAALDSRVWKEFTEGVVAVLVKSPQKCDGCGHLLETGDVACRVTANEDLSIKYLCSRCYDNFKRGKRHERRMGGHVYTKER
jgi:hypothetical protein